MAPKRGNTMEKFLEKCKKYFYYEITDKILPEIDSKIIEISKQKLYRETEHKPYLIIMKIKNIYVD